MAKVRVYELARELNIESKDLVTKLKALGMEVASHQSSLTDQQVLDARKTLGGGGNAAKPAAAAGKRTIIRRRKKAEPEVEAEPVAAAPEPEPDPAPEVVQASPEPKPVVEVSAEPAPEVAPKVASAATEVEAAEEAPVQTTADSKSKEAAPVEEAAPAPKVAPKTKEETAAAPRPVRKVITAKIVRRATPEELEKDRVRAAARAPRGRPAASRPGAPARPSAAARPGAPARPASGGQGGGRPQPGVDHSQADAEIDRSAKGGDARRRGGKGGKISTAQELAQKAAAAASTKVKRGGFNARDILRDINSMTPEDEDTLVEKIQAKAIYIPKSKGRRDKRRNRADMKQTQITVPKASLRIVKMGHSIQVSDLALQLNIKAIELIKHFMAQGEMVTINQSIDFDTASLICEEYQYEVKSNLKSVEEIIAEGNKAGDVQSVSRPPIVTIMGHVDHGKTSILDAIREENVASGEKGGITQHIGAYTVNRNGKRLAFLDTPGHEAFSAMRARGAAVTDIVIIVVAADDGVMPQTIEAISHSKAAGVPIIIAINKMDKPNLNLDRIHSELTEHGIQSEEWGGDIQFIKVSAHTKMGLDDLLDSVSLQAEVLELKSRPTGPAEGAVVESHLDRNLGPVATIMVQAGELNVGDTVVAGEMYGKVRIMHNHAGKVVKKAGPSTPVQLIGLSGTPSAGDIVNAVVDEKLAREVADWRKDKAAAAAGDKSSASTLEQLLGKIQSDAIQKLPLIVKGDTQGSVEAVCESIKKLDTDKIENRFIHKGVGGITESDITLAEASGAIIVAFNVRAGRGLDTMAEDKGAVIQYFSIIYDVVDAVKNLMVGQLPPILEEVVVGHAEVRQKISVPKIGTIAGTAVTDGKITRASKLRLIRDEVVIYSGDLGSLRRFKDDVKEVASGYECGIGISGYNDIRIGDVIEAYVIEETAATLD